MSKNEKEESNRLVPNFQKLIYPWIVKHVLNQFVCLAIYGIRTLVLNQGAAVPLVTSKKLSFIHFMSYLLDIFRVGHHYILIWKMKGAANLKRSKNTRFKAHSICELISDLMITFQLWFVEWICFTLKENLLLPKTSFKSTNRYFLRPEIKGALGLFCTLKIQILGKSIAP